MLLGLVSDTHDDLPLARAAAAFLRAQACDLVLHLGDVTGAPAVEAFAGLPVRFLCGNNDEPAHLAPTLARLGFPPLEDAWSDVLAGVRVAAHHGHRLARFDGEEPHLLAHGHTHHRRLERVGRTLVVNPGALHRARVKSLALVDLPSLDVRFFAVGEHGVRPLDPPG